MEKIPLVKGLKKYIEEYNSPFSMPGHKQGRGFNIPSLGVDLEEIILKADLTEVDGLDNLHKPEGIIKESLEELRNLYKSEKSYFLVNGSTSGNLIMIFSSLNEGDKVLVERNCHRSIFNGIIMRKLRPIYLKNKMSSKMNVPISFDIKQLEDIINKENIKAIILTYPNYYGIGCDLERVINLCRERNIKILIDSAHGAHFGINKNLPKNAVELGADMVVMSAHKTLPSLTQTAFLHINNKELIEKADFFVGVFSSTSPSYMFMASMDYGRAFLQYEGKNAYDKLIQRIDKLKDDISDKDYIKIIDEDFLNEDIKENNLSLDKSRIVFNLKKGFSGHKFLDYLRENRIQAEMSDDCNVVLIPTVFNTEEDFKRLTGAIKNCDLNYIKSDSKELEYLLYDIPKTIIEPYKVMDSEKKDVLIEEACGFICADNIVPYPPGVPFIMMGEQIEKRHIEVINNLIKMGVTILGINNNYIKIVEEQV